MKNYSSAKHLIKTIPKMRKFNYSSLIRTCAKPILCALHIITFFILTLPFAPSFAANKKAPSSLPAVLKADKIEGDRVSNILDALGNVELKKDGNTLFADKLSYNKEAGDVTAFGNIRINNYDIGNLLASKLEMKSDFKSGSFSEATIIFNNGSYIKSPKIIRNNEVEMVFTNPIFSVCPNDEIQANNLLAGKEMDMISITSNKTTINKTTDSIKTDGGVVRIYNFPIFYTPYLSTPLPSSKRKSGLLNPSYVNTTKLGSGLKIPYYFNIAPEKDLTSTIEYHPSGEHLILSNNYRHLLQNGNYDINLELANNNPKTNALMIDEGEGDTKLREYLTSNGNLTLSKNSAVDFQIDTTGDKNYLRDYRNQFISNTTSEVNLDYIKNDEYASVKTVRIQELEIGIDEKGSPWALPIVNYYKSSKPQGGIFNQSYSALINSTFITRESGLQYRRFSATPEVKIPYNLMGNLFEASANVQGDFYNLENNYNTPQDRTNFNSTSTNYRPSANLKWSLPLVNKYKTNTLIIEPLANIALSQNKHKGVMVPNEDSNNTELTQNNLFLSDHFTGFDRSEEGLRATYGFKSSLFNEKVGKFNFGLGQSLRAKNEMQDVLIRGFNKNKSNIVGEFLYKAPKLITLFYNFQLNESSYRNDINEIGSTLNYKKISVGSNYILIRKTSVNPDERKQLNMNIGFRITEKLITNINDTRDLVNNRAISRKYGISYNGCCVTYGFYLSEDNPTALAKPQRSYDVNFVIKNL